MNILVLMALIGSNLSASETTNAETRLVIKKIDKALSNTSNFEMDYFEKQVDINEDQGYSFSITLIKKEVSK